MAILSVTAANVGVGSLATRTQIVQAGEAISHGQSVYFNSSDSKYYRCDADFAGSANCAGIAISSASTDGFFVLATSGLVNVGSTLTVGKAYYVATTPGGIDDEAALATGDFVTFLGVATTTSLLLLDIAASGVAKA